MKDCFNKFKDTQEFRRSLAANKRAELFNNNPAGFDALIEQGVWKC